MPLISMVSAPDFTWAGPRVGSVDNPSYIITPFMSLAGKMTFWQRLENTYTYIVANVLFKVGSGRVEKRTRFRKSNRSTHALRAAALVPGPER